MSLPDRPARRRACTRCRDWLRSQSPLLQPSRHEAVGHRPFVGIARNGAFESELENKDRVEPDATSLTLSELVKLYEESLSQFDQKTQATRRSILKQFKKTWDHGFEISVKNVTPARLELWFPLRFPQPREAIGTPLFGPHAVMDEEEAGRVILLFHRRQSGVIRTPEGLLPGALEEVAFRDIGPCPGYDLQQFVHRCADLAGMSASDCNIRLMTGDAGESRRSTAGDDRQGKRIQHSGIRGGVPGRRQFFGRRPGKSLVEMQGHTPMAATREERIHEARLLIPFQ